MCMKRKDDRASGIWTEKKKKKRWVKSIFPEKQVRKSDVDLLKQTNKQKTLLTRGKKHTCTSISNRKRSNCFLTEWGEGTRNTQEQTRLFPAQLWTNYQIYCRGIHISRCLMTPEPVTDDFELSGCSSSWTRCHLISIFHEPQSENWDVS